MLKEIADVFVFVCKEVGFGPTMALFVFLLVPYLVWRNSRLQDRRIKEQKQQYERELNRLVKLRNEVHVKHVDELPSSTNDHPNMNAVIKDVMDEKNNGSDISEHEQMNGTQKDNNDEEGEEE
jgi:C4-dicarboxylate-specific signal transduction histidine kinase